MTFIKGDNTYQTRPRHKVYIKVTPLLIADASGVTRGAVHKAIERGVLDPVDLVSVARYITKHTGGKDE